LSEGNERRSSHAPSPLVGPPKSLRGGPGSAGGRLASLQRPSCLGRADEPAGFAWQGGGGAASVSFRGAARGGTVSLRENTRKLRAAEPRGSRSQAPQLPRGGTRAGRGSGLGVVREYRSSTFATSAPRGTPRRRRSALVQPPPSYSIRGATCDRGCVTVRGAGGETLHRGPP
jgi:hypothetical protein